MDTDPAFAPPVKVFTMVAEQELYTLGFACALPPAKMLKEFKEQLLLTREIPSPAPPALTLR